MNDDLPRVYYPLSVLDELREQRILDNDDLARAYDMGRDKERAVVVAYLARCGLIGAAENVRAGDHRIERGEHRREEEP
jgi:hypothetical protein